jgi:beta-1,4-N-acetylglucosaminyltransferase
LIFVTIGSAVKGIEFTRFVKKMDEIAGKIDEEMIMQIGTVPYEPQHASFFAYCSYQESLKYFEKASLIVGHCGAGTILNATKFQVPIVVFPRRHQYGEHVDDHQVELARRIEGMPLIHVVYELEELEGTVKRILSRNRFAPGHETFSERRRLVEAIKQFIERTR